MKRREFTSFVGIGVGMSIVPAALTACDAQTKNHTTASSDTSDDGFEEVGSISQLDISQLEQTGQVFHEQITNITALFILDPAKGDELIAVNPTCTHADCAVTWESEQQKFLCPCHDSEFSSGGEVLEGPATEPLTSYEVKLEGDSILVKTT